MFKLIGYFVAALIILTIANSLMKAGVGILWLLPLYALEIFIVEKAIKAYRSKKVK